MVIEIGRSIRNFVIFVAISVVMMPGVLALEPSYLADHEDLIIVDGNNESFAGEWNLANHFFADMYKAAKTEKEVLSKLYLQYDCIGGTLYAMVLLEPGYVINDNAADNQFIKINKTFGSNLVFKLVDANTGNDGFVPDFEYIFNGTDIIGWEASTDLPVGSYRLNVHTQVYPDDTSAVTDRDIPLEIYCDPYIPEFPTITLPIAAILGLMFIFGRKRDL